MVNPQTTLARHAEVDERVSYDAAPHAPSTFISAVIPTLNRLDPLRRALRSAIAQELPSGVRYEIVVIDNSTDANVRNVVADVAALAKKSNSTAEIRYVSEPNPGLSNARNAGVAAARGDWIAFLDDDQEASPRWLKGFLIAIQNNRADAIFGPIDVEPEIKGQTLGPNKSLFHRHYEMMSGGDLTHRSAYLGTNNSFFNVQRCFTTRAPFSTKLNSFGGEDSLLLKQLVTNGRRLAWAAEAKVTEFVPPHRMTRSYYFKRRFLSGQIRTLVYSMLQKPQWSQVAFWMAVGAIQFTVLGLGSLWYMILEPEIAFALQAAAFGGLGKLLWMKPFRDKLYAPRPAHAPSSPS